MLYKYVLLKNYLYLRDIVKSVFLECVYIKVVFEKVGLFSGRFLMDF